MALAVLIGLMVPLSVLVTFSRSLFRLFRQMAAEVNEQTQQLTLAAVDRRVYVLTFTVLLPMVVYLAAVVSVGLHQPRRSYLWRQESGIDPSLFGILVVVASALATVSFPLVYRFGSVPFRQLGKTAAKVLTLPVLCIGLACWITYVAARSIVRIPELKFHDPRKTFASLLAQRGVSIAVTQRLLEHSSPPLTNDVYTNVDPVLRQPIDQRPVPDWV